MPRLIFGYDPGKDGAIVCMDLGTGAIAIKPVPLLGTGKGKGAEIDWAEIVTFIRDQYWDADCGPADCVAVSEKTWGRPIRVGGKELPGSAKSMFVLGGSCEGFRAVCCTIGIPLLRPTPQAWKKLILEGTPKDKSAAIKFCRSRWPMLDLRRTPRCKKDHDGIADALCLAEYGRRIEA
jgi:crossover junction endodeoxyribonuclease RuvC